MNSTKQLARVRQMCRSGVAKAIREANAISLREVAADIGVSQVTIYRWETARTQPSGEDAMRYLQLLDELSVK